MEKVEVKSGYCRRPCREVSQGIIDQLDNNPPASMFPKSRHAIEMGIARSVTSLIGAIKGDGFVKSSSLPITPFLLSP